jgi:STE24 endopeptidase
MPDPIESPAELEPTPPETKRYERLKDAAGILSVVTSLLVLAAAAFYLGPAIDRAVRGLVGDNRWLRLIALGAVYAAALELVSLPIDFWSGFVLEHRFGLSKQSFAAWAVKRLKGYALGAPLGLLLLLGLYGFIWFSGSWWWVGATAGWLAVTLILGRILPVLILPLFYKVTRLDDPALLDRLRRLAAGTGLEVEGVYRLHLSAETVKANAALAGLGRSRRVLLGDTLLDQFGPEEIEVVFAHEVGHHVHRHLIQMIAFATAVTAAGFWVAGRVLESAAPALGYPDGADPSALPLLLLTLAAVALLVTPAQNALSRHFERQCDRYALRRTGNPAAFRSAFERLARLNKVDPDPNPLVVWLMHDHPPIRQRLALADEVAVSRAG